MPTHSVSPAPAAPVDRLARWLRWLRWPVVIAWVFAVVLLYSFSHTLSSKVNDTPQANLPANAPSTKVVDIDQKARAGQPNTDGATVVFVRDGGLTPTDLQAITAAHAAVGDLVGQVPDLGAPGAPQQSPDKSALQFTAIVTAQQADLSTADTAAIKAIRAAVAAPVRQAGDGLQVAVTGSAAVTADSGLGDQSVLLLTSLSIVVIILLIVYRSPLLWIFPLFGTIASLVVAKAVTHGLANGGLTVTSLSTAILTVLVLGASTDYAMLLVHRYREELRVLPAPAEAMAVALRRTIPAILASSATVICAMLCLLAARSASLHGLGPVAAVSIVSVVLAQCTLLPALLLLVGRPGFWPLVPRLGQTGRDESKVWKRIGDRVGQRPVMVVCASVFVLAAACAGLASLHTDNNPIALVKGNPGSVAGEKFVIAHFPAGDTGPLTLLSPPGQADQAVAVAQATPNVASVSPGDAVGDYSSATIVMSVPPYGSSGYATIADLRHRLSTAAPGALIGGDPAVQYDTSRAAHRDALLLIPLVLVVVLIIISLLVRAIVASLVLVATTALSFASSFGLASLLWHALGYAGIEAQLPLYVFVFLVALGVDYNIFLIARIREEAVDVGIREGTLRGLKLTGGVITAAGIVLAATFGSLSRLPYVPVAQVGSAIAIGVLLDTLLVRTVLVPASLLILGERSWWPSRSSGRRGADDGDRAGTETLTLQPAETSAT